MRIYIVEFIVLLCYHPVFYQLFKGQISYKLTYKTAIPNVTAAQLHTQLGSEQQLYVTGGNFEFASNGKSFQWRIYNWEDHRLYTKLPSSDTLRFKEAMDNPYKIESVNTTKSNVPIQGFHCSETVFIKSKAVFRFYYVAKPALNPILYAESKFACFADFFAISKSWPLKMVFEENGITVTYVATKIDAHLLAESIISVPKKPSTPQVSYPQPPGQ